MTKVQQHSEKRPPGCSQLGKVISDIAKQCEVSAGQIEDLYPCTPLQHALLALSTASKGAYVAQHVFKLQDSVDLGRMKSAWEIVVRRNAILRTRIAILELRALQVVIRDDPVIWGDCTDLAPYLEKEKQCTIRDGDQLSRFAVSKTHVVWTVHHSLYDGSSVELLLDDVAAAYENKSRTVRAPFRNFVKYVQSRTDEAQWKAFWTSRLSVEDVPSFPMIHQSNYRPSPNRSLEHFAEGVSISPASRVTKAIIVQAAWGLVLSSHLSSSAVSFGLTVNGRNTAIPGIESIMGPTIATVPICLQLDHEQDVASYLRTVQQYSIDMIPYQHAGLQRIKNLSKEAAQACNFQNLLAVHTAEDDSSLPRYDHLIQREEAKTQEHFFDYPMTVQCSLARDGTMRALATFDEALVRLSLMHRLLSQLEHVVRQLGSASSSKKLREIDLVSPEEQKQIKTWNSKPAGSPGLPFEEIRKHFQIRPKSTAICSWDGELSYSDLDKISSQLATYLASQHEIGPEVIVPVCFDRSFWMVVAVVAVMRTGAAFTLLDPAYPSARLHHIAELTKCDVILLSGTRRELFSQASSKHVVIDENLLRSSRAEDEADVDFQEGRARGVDHTNAMYVVFTSGSTGVPKGVVVTHGSYYASAMAHIPLYELSPQSRYLLFGSPAFDLCIHEIVSTLMAGGCLCVPSQDDHMGDITSVIRSMDVNLASFTSSFARQICPEDVSSLKILALVGEPLAKDQQEAWADRLCLLNSYGPSECSVITNISKGLTKSSNTANIGPVITGSSWIADPSDHDRLVPIGAVGELLIEGPLLGRGYLNDPEKTASAFIESPRWAINPNGKPRRFYKTGDLVRYDNDGSLLFEGRKDTQIKIRGQRVEIGEIEYHLRSLFPKASGVAVECLKQENVSQLIALVFCDGKGDVTADCETLLPLLTGSRVATVSDVKTTLGKSLPSHMVPSKYRLVQTQPLLPSGKLDRKRLREEILKSSASHHELQQSTLQLPYIDPGNHVALVLCDRLLKLSSTTDAAKLSRKDFYLSSLSLDSIQIISVSAFIRKEFDVSLSIAIWYDDSIKVSTLAKIISDRKTGTRIHNTDNQTVDLQSEVSASNQTVLRTDESACHVKLHPDMAQIKKTVFLTGATGYLGTEILHQLITDASVKKVIVHVRAENATKALDRVVNAAEKSRWWSPPYLSRIECWPGDLAEPRLGLPPDRWRIVAGDCAPEKRISSIIHNGAAVQWQAPYSALKAANVDSTVDLLSAVRQCAFPTDFTYVSGGVKKESGAHIIPENELHSRATALKDSNGYSQTKFVSEEVVAKFAQSHSMHAITIVRPGLIIGTEEEGIPNTDDFLWKFVQACTDVGSYPAADQSSWLAVADVRETATRTLKPRPELGSRGLNIVDIDAGVKVQDFWSVVTEELGINLQPISGEDWVSAIKKVLEHARDDHPYGPLMAMLQGSTFSLGADGVVAAKSHPRVCRAIRKNMETLLRTGFLPVKRSGGEESTSLADMTMQDSTFSRSGVVKGRPGQAMKA